MLLVYLYNTDTADTSTKIWRATYSTQNMHKSVHKYHFVSNSKAIFVSVTNSWPAKHIAFQDNSLALHTEMNA